ncbi:MAG TPA: M23 family metallopeptidase [Clostridia bacterium]|nr:M23 family metallopeptidase [Clostridia bacterium]
MFSNYFKSVSIFYLAVLVFFSTSICIFTPIFYNNNLILDTSNSTKFFSVSDNFAWPVPNSYTISSNFGYRIQPTAGASRYHTGIDISGLEKSDIISVLSGKVVFRDFYGSAGCTIIVQSDNFLIFYCHISPNYIVNVGENVIKGQVIGHIGPKNVYGIIDNKYKDEYGYPTNGATTGPHLHLTIKKDGKAVNPLDYINISKPI